MTATAAPRTQQVARLAAVVGVLGIADGLAALGDHGRVTADYVRSLHLPGTPAPDTSRWDGLVAATSVEALVAVVIGVALLLRGGRTVFAMAAVLSAFAPGTTVLAIATMAELEAIAVGPLQLSPVATAVAIATAAVISIGAAAFGWHDAPSESHIQTPHMPPPTHQA